MKKNNFFLAIISFGLFFASCQPETEIKTTLIDFEDVALVDSVWNGSDLSGGYTINNSIFKNSYDSASFGGFTMYFWSGFACSAKKDTQTGGFFNQYSVIAGSGALSSKQFALAYDSASVTCSANENGNFKIASAMITNSTYAYLDMLNGSDYSKKFTTGDWFKVIITGYLNNVKQSSVEYYLADFRDGKSILSKTWQKVDLSSIGTVDRLSLTFDSSDKTGGWMNTPAYACIDNVVFEQEIKE